MSVLLQPWPKHYSCRKDSWVFLTWFSHLVLLLFKMLCRFLALALNLKTNTHVTIILFCLEDKNGCSPCRIILALRLKAPSPWHIAETPWLWLNRFIANMEQKRISPPPKLSFHLRPLHFISLFTAAWGKMVFAKMYLNGLSQWKHQLLRIVWFVQRYTSDRSHLFLFWDPEGLLPAKLSPHLETEEEESSVLGPESLSKKVCGCKSNMNCIFNSFVLQLLGLCTGYKRETQTAQRTDRVG